MPQRGSAIAEPIEDQIIRKVGQAAGMYHRLVVVAAPAGSGKTAALRQVAARTSAPLLNVNLELSLHMLDLTERQRALRLPHLLAEIVQSTGGSLLLLDNIEILFDVALKQDPLRLLQMLSRNKTVVVAWNGSIDNGHVVYAAPEHREYRRYPIRDLLAICPGIDE